MEFTCSQADVAATPIGVRSCTTAVPAGVALVGVCHAVPPFQALPSDGLGGGACHARTRLL